MPHVLLNFNIKQLFCLGDTSAMAGKRKLKRSKSDEQLNYPVKELKEDTREDQREDGSSMGKIYKRVFFRLAMVFTMIMSARYFMGGPPEVPFVLVEEKVERRFFEVPCSSDYAQDLKKFKECAPLKCGRTVMDYVVTKEEAKTMLNVAKKGMALGSPNGGAMILDLHSGALTKGDKFVNIYSLLPDVDGEIFTKEDFKLYSEIKNRIKKVISETFQIPTQSLHLTKPTFFSRLNNKPAKTIHDEYWHSHVDKKTYGSFDYTSLLYLSDYNLDFLGGRFFFKDPEVNRTVEPRAGRVSFFTSGSENTHFVERVHKGTRYAITVSFTCDPSLAIKDPVLPPSAK